MKYLRFNFCHPIKVRANLSRLGTNKHENHTLLLDSKDSTLIEIPVSTLTEGKWMIILEWEHDGQLFSHQKEFEIKKTVPINSKGP